jgi:hypothetical protein
MSLAVGQPMATPSREDEWEYAAREAYKLMAIPRVAVMI